MTLSQTEIDARWIEYARNVLTCAGGAMNCCVSGDTDRFSRWPGYLGPDYATGRVLFVGAVHNQDDMDATLPATGDAALKWINGANRSDSDYLALLRAEYTTAMNSWAHGSSVFAKFAEIRAALGVSAEQTATTNIAKCTAVSGSKKYRQSISECPLRFPLPDLIARLDPLIVFIACNDPRARIAGVESTAARRVYRFQQRNSLEYETSRRRDDWLPEAAAFYRSRDESRQETAEPRS